MLASLCLSISFANKAEFVYASPPEGSVPAYYERMTAPASGQAPDEIGADADTGGEAAVGGASDAPGGGNPAAPGDSGAPVTDSAGQNAPEADVLDNASGEHAQPSLVDPDPSEAGRIELYVYKTAAGETLYRVCGYVSDKPDDIGFFASDAAGKPTEPYELLDQAAEAANALQSEMELMSDAASSLGLSLFALTAGFTPLEPASNDLRIYYIADTLADVTIFHYKISDDVTLYRVYGRYEDPVSGALTEAGYFACDAAGGLTAPYVPLDQADEAANAFVAGRIEQELKPNALYVSLFSLEKYTDGTPDIQTGGMLRWDTDGNVFSGVIDAPGHDGGQANNVVRSFDSMTYTLHYITAHQPGRTEYYREGDLFIEFTIPGVDKTQANFDLGAMNWLEDAKLVYDESTDDGDGKKIVLTGKRHISSNAGVAALPGEGNLSVVVNVLGMANNAVIEPQFRAWLYGYDSKAPGASGLNTPTAALEYDYDSDGNVILNTGRAIHTTKVSAAPALNIVLTSNASCYYEGLYPFDF
jgi:hypothetical protein